VNGVRKRLVDDPAELSSPSSKTISAATD